MTSNLNQFERKLTQTQVAWVKGVVLLDRRERKRAGLKRGSNGIVDRLAQHLGVSRWCIESIIRRRRWRGIKPKRM